MLSRVFTAAPRTLANSAATLVASRCKEAGHGQTVRGSGKDACRIRDWGPLNLYIIKIKINTQKAVGDL